MIKNFDKYIEENFTGDIYDHMRNAVNYAKTNSVERIFEIETVQEFYSMFFFIKDYLTRINKYAEYELEYCKFVEALHDKLVNEAFDVDEEKRKEFLTDALSAVKKLMNLKRYFELLDKAN